MSSWSKRHLKSNLKRIRKREHDEELKQRKNRAREQGHEAAEEERTRQQRLKEQEEQDAQSEEGGRGSVSVSLGNKA